MAKADTEKPKKAARPKPKLSDEERHERFVALAHEIEAKKTQASFDRAFDVVVKGRIATRREG